MRANGLTEHGHVYAARLVWDGNTGSGTAGYTTYEREYSVTVEGKPVLHGSADPVFRGAPDRHNPEEHFLIATAACHMLAYLALCARQGVRVLAYEDSATGTLTLNRNGGGRFSDVLLSPEVTIADDADADLARRLHDTAHEWCFLANSCSIPIRHDASIRRAGAQSRPMPVTG